MKKEVFIPRPDQVDYSNARFAPVINCAVVYKNKILLLKRNKHLRFYPNYWNGVSGFLDDKKTLKEKIEEELSEELGISKKYIINFKMGSIFHQEEKKYKKTWIVHPMLVNISTDNIKLDWEAQEYKWVTLNEAKKMKLLPGFDIVLKNVFK